MVKRKPNKFSRPRKIFDKARIEEENRLQKNFGLKNKREIWKASARVSELRSRAKSLISKSEDQKKEFFNRLDKMGLKADSIADVLALTLEDWLNRRLQSVVLKKGLAKTPLEARQLIVHKNVYVNARLINKPSFIVTKELENKITLKERKLKENKEEKNE